MKEEYVFVDGKKYRRGYTTGSCATAATKASLISFFLKRKTDLVRIWVPKGYDIDINIESQIFESNLVESFVKKDGGDDIDATNGMLISSKVEIVDLEYESENICDTGYSYIEITSGEGVGIVTKSGLSVDVGRPAINPTPLRMICEEVLGVLDEFEIDFISEYNDKKILITISALNGVEIAKNTFNENLGIIGGISIIGTTGIVEPMSDEGWKKALSAELSIKKSEGREEIVLVPGNIGFETMSSKYLFDKDSIVKMSNFTGYMLMECKRLGFKKILIAGHIGKLIKLSAGIMNSHSRVADARSEIMVSNLALLDAKLDFLEMIDKCVTTDAMVELIDKNGYNEVFDVISKKAAQRAKKYLRENEDIISIEVWLFDIDGNLLSKYEL